MRDRVGLNDDGSLDEIVAAGVDLHIEQMDDDHWWLGFYKPDGTTVHVHFWRKGKTVRAMHSVEQGEWPEGE